MEPTSPTKDECNMAMLAHLLGIFTGFLGALVVWLMKKDSSSRLVDHEFYLLHSGRNFGIEGKALQISVCHSPAEVIGAFTKFATDDSRALAQESSARPAGRAGDLLPPRASEESAP